MCYIYTKFLPFSKNARCDIKANIPIETKKIFFKVVLYTQVNLTFFFFLPSHDDDESRKRNKRDSK